MTPEHEWSPGNPRCIHCGTKKEHHEMKAQTCVPRWSTTEKLYPLPDRRQPAVEDAETISARIRELRAETEASLNRKAEDA